MVCPIHAKPPDKSTADVALSIIYIPLSGSCGVGYVGVMGYLYTSRSATLFEPQKGLRMVKTFILVRSCLSCRGFLSRSGGIVLII